VKVTPEQLTDADRALAEIRIELDRDLHLAKCGLAKSGGPDATLACAECGRAQWMHGTRHDTCSQFCYVTSYTITSEMLQVLRFAHITPHEVRVSCSRALNDFGLNDAMVREAKRTCAAAFNRQRRAVVDALHARRGDDT